ncbi:MAG: hypothetical protein ACREOZ_00135 [Gloeomargaritales cyanobacterium]
MNHFKQWIEQWRNRMGDEAQEQGQTQEQVQAREKEALQVRTHAVPHVWKRGILPGQKYIKICAIPFCGVSEEVTMEEWQKLA